MENLVLKEENEPFLTGEEEGLLRMENNQTHFLEEGEFLEGEEVIPEERNALEHVLYSMLEKAIDGIPNLYIESTKTRCARYLSENNGDQYLAFQSSKEKNFSISAKIYRAIFESIPILGIPVALTYPVWKLMRALCLLAALYDHDIYSEDVQEKILRCFSSSSSDLAMQSGKPIAVQAATSVTKTTVLPEITSVLANRAAASYIATGVKYVSTQDSLGSEVALETAGSILAGKYGGLATKFIASKTGLIEVLNGVTTSIGNRIISQGIPNVVTQKMATNTIIQTSVSRSATIGATAVTGAVIIPLNLFLGWILDNSEEIFKSARHQFVPQTSAEDLISSFEIIGVCDEKDDSFQILETISFLQALPEQETGQGYFFSWYKLGNQDSGSKFYIQQWGLYRSAYRIVCQHFRPNFILPLISCGTLEDTTYVLNYLQKLEENLDYNEFLGKLNQNELYLKELICFEMEK